MLPDQHRLQSILILLLLLGACFPSRFAGEVTAAFVPPVASKRAIIGMPIFESEAVSATSAPETLRQHIASITSASDNNDDVQLLPSSEFKPSSPYANATEINSLVFRPKASHVGDEKKLGVTYAVAILQSRDKVDVKKLSSLLSQSVEGSTYDRWELAPSYLVEDLCGFRPGSIPPFGYPNKPSWVIVDKSLTELANGALLVGGGGSLDYRCLIRAEELVRYAAAEVCSIAEPRERFDGGMLPATGIEKEKYQKPFFQIAPPRHSLDTSSEQCSHLEQLHRPVPVTAIGRVTSVRRIAKRLVFADFAPPDYPVDSSFSSSEKQSEYEKDMPWLSGEDGKPMYVQMIVGKTFCDSLGEEEGPEALKALKPGALVIFRGAANVDPRQKNGWSNSAGNWAQKRSLDVIVSSFSILSSPEDTEDALKSHQQSIGILPWELKRRRSSSGNNVPTKRSKDLLTEPNKGANGPILTLDLYNSELQKTQTTILNVDTIDRVDEMSTDFAQLLSLTTTTEGDDDPLDFVLGIDCEWRPTGAFGSEDFDGNPVALLQICAPALSKIFLVDTFTLLRSGLSLAEVMTPEEKTLSDAIASVFRASSIIKTGFHVAIDFRRLAASFPHIPAFNEVHSVVELSQIARKVHPTTSRHSIGSLQRLTRMAMGYDVSKEQQCSDWQHRPLLPEQSEYAALDCALPPLLLNMMAEGAGRAKTQSVLPQSMSSWRFVTIDSDNQDTITLLKAKRVVGGTFAVSQSWLAGKPAPEPPSMPTEGGVYVDKSGISRIPSHLVQIHSDSNISWENVVGKSAGKSKGKCVDLISEHALPEKNRLEYNPRSGFVPFKDGIVLFVNMPSPGQSRRSPYPNEWLNGGKTLTWYLREKEWQCGESETAKLLGFGSSNGTDEAPAVLFVRSASGEFICCGKCSAFAPDGDLEALGTKGKKLILLHIELKQWNMLKDSPAFTDILRQSVEDASVGASKEEENLIDVATVTDSTSFQETLARMVIEGNVIDALGFALEASKTDPKKRSIAAGVGCLKNIFARSNDADVLRAVEILDDTAARLGLF